MPAESSPEQLQPYLNPAYWDGHSLGIGEAEEHPPRPRFFGQSRRQAKRNLQDRLLTMNRAIPLQSYQGGEAFEAEEYEPGTVVLFRQETLRGPADMELPAPEVLADLPLPSRPLDVSPNFGALPTDSTFLRDEDSKVNYASRSMWGVTQEDKSRMMLYFASTGTTIKFENGKVSVMLLNWLRSPIEMGETKHYRSKDGSREVLERINVLDVVAYGKTQKKKSRVRAALGNLSLRPHEA